MKLLNQATLDLKCVPLTLESSTIEQSSNSNERIVENTIEKICPYCNERMKPTEFMDHVMENHPGYSLANNGTADNPMGCTPNEMVQAASQASIVSLALLKLEAQGPTIIHTDKLQGIINSEKTTFDESNIQPLGNNSQANSNNNPSMISG